MFSGLNYSYHSPMTNCIFMLNHDRKTEYIVWLALKVFRNKIAWKNEHFPVAYLLSIKGRQKFRCQTDLESLSGKMLMLSDIYLKVAFEEVIYYTRYLSNLLGPYKFNWKYLNEQTLLDANQKRSIHINNWQKPNFPWRYIKLDQNDNFFFFLRRIDPEIFYISITRKL